MDTIVKVIEYIIYVAIGFSILEVYLKVNKIWKRKHEKEVAESQSLYGLGLSLFLLFLWTIKYLVDGDYQSIMDNSVYIVESLVLVVIGSGLFVRDKKGTGFFTLIKQALRLERKEANYLLKSLSGRKEAEKIMSILHQLAMVDDDLDPNELKMIKEFAKQWDIDFDENNFQGGTFELEDKLNNLRSTLEAYLDGAPNREQVAQLKDLMSKMIEADDVITSEEETIFAEAEGLIENYLNKNNEAVMHHVIIVPQEAKHEALIKEFKPDADKIQTAGGVAYSIAQYYSYKYADMMCNQYRKKNLFTIVYSPNQNS